MARRVSSPFLVGREPELEAIDASLDMAGTGGGRHLLMMGEAGIGKSRLVDEVARRAELRGMRVLRGECDGIGDVGLPYAPIAEALRALTRAISPTDLQAMLGENAPELSRIAPELGLEGGSVVAAEAGRGAPAKVFEALLGLLVHVGRDAPVVVILEDLQWADSATLDAVRYLVDHTHEHPVLLALTARSDELHPRHPLTAWLAQMRRSGRVERLDLRAFDATEVRAQIAGILGTEPADDVVASIVDRSDGNAFFVEELVAGEGDRRGAPLSSPVREIMHARLAALSEGCQAILAVAAVSGRRVDHDLLVVVAGLSDADLGSALREATTHQVLVVDATEGTDGYAFRHALLREVVYTDLLPGERRRLHRSYAQALSARGDSGRPTDAGYWAELAYHWDLARDTEMAFTTAIGAADAARNAYAFGAALARYSRALELWDRVDAPSTLAGFDRAELLDRAALAANLSVDYARQIELCRAAVEALPVGTDGPRAGVLRARLAFALWQLQDLRGAVAVARDAVAMVPADPPTLERAEVVARLGHILTHDGLDREAATLASEAVTIARALDATGIEGFALNVLGSALAWQGNLEDGLRALEQSLEIALHGRDGWDTARACQNLSEGFFVAGAPDRARELLDRGFQVAERAGISELYRPLLLAQGALYGFGWGDWEEAARLAAEALSTAEADSFDEAYVLAYTAELLVGRTNDDTVEQALDRLAELLKRFGTDPQLLGPYVAARAEFELWRHRPEAAFAAVDDGLARLVETDERWFVSRLVRLGLRSLADRSEVSRARRDPRAVRASRAALGDLDRAAERCRVALDGRPNGFELELMADAATGIAERSRLDGTPDPAFWEQARDLWRARVRPYHAAYAEWRRAEALLGRGDRDAAAGALREASAISFALGARPLAVEIESLARRARIDLRRPSAPAAAQQPSISLVARLGLTAREMEVLGLLAQGRTNREIAETLFISINTADVHVSRILGKLDASSRTEAATMAVRLGLVPA